MKRRLVIYNEAKRHWFRQQVPAHVLAVPPTELFVAKPEKSLPRFFASSFAAGFIAVSIFIF
jgi:hypothetical protein